jgi:PAS domain S-box-containing protein
VLVGASLLAVALAGFFVGAQSSTRQWPPGAAAGLVALVIGVPLVALLPTVWKLRRERVERERPEDLLREAETFFRQVGEYSGEVFYLCEWPAGGILYLSPAFAQVFGLPMERAFSSRHQWHESILPEDREPVIRLWDSQTSEVRFDSEYRVALPDGTVHWLHDFAFLLSDPEGCLNRVVGIARDVSVHRREANRFRDLIEAAPDAMLIVDSEGRIELLNAQTETLFGYARDELLGTSIDRLVPDRFREAHRATRDRYLENPTVRPMGGARELHGLRKGGEEVAVEISLSPLRWGDTRLVCAAVRDVSGLRETRYTLQRQSTELESANRALSETNRELERFAYIASHDLREPLRAVAGFAQLLARRYKGEFDERADGYIQHILNGAERMSALLRDLLAYSRIDTQPGSFELVPLERLLTSAVSGLGALVAETGAEITQDALPELRVHPTQISELFQNLIANALKFRRESKPCIHVSARRVPDGCEVSVRDNGIGIDPRFKERIFTIFQRLHTQEEYEGTGIGLTICKRIVQRHGGRIWVEPNAEGGSTFSFTLPDREEAAAS